MIFKNKYHSLMEIINEKKYNIIWVTFNSFPEKKTNSYYSTGNLKKIR